MKQNNAGTAEPADLVILGLEILSDTIAIECMMCQIIDNDLDIDCLEYVLFLIQQQTQRIVTVLEKDIPELNGFRVPLLSYANAMASMSIKVIEHGDEFMSISEAILTAARQQKPHINSLISAIAEL